MTSKTTPRRLLNATEMSQGQQNNKWEDRENRQGKNCYTNIPLVRNDI